MPFHIRYVEQGEGLKVTRIGAKRPKGFGETFPRAPQGLSRSDWGWIVIDGDYF